MRHRLQTYLTIVFVLLLGVTPNTAEPANTFTTIDVPGARFTIPVGINSSGDIVGLYGDTTGVHGFLLSKHGVFSTIDFPKARDTRAFGINSSGDIVGIYRDASNLPPPWFSAKQKGRP